MFRAKILRAFRLALKWRRVVSRKRLASNVLHAERLHYAEPLEHLVHDRVHVAQPLLALVRAVAQLASEVHDRPQQQRRQDEGREGEAEVQREDQDQETDHREGILQEVGEAVGDRGRDLLDVVGDARHEDCRRLLLVVPRRLRDEGVHQPVTEVLDRGEAGAEEGVVPQVDEEVS